MIALARSLMLLALSGAWHGAQADLSVSGFQATPRLDVRFEGGSGMTDSAHIMQSEIDIRFSVNKDNEELVAFSLGPNLETDMEGRARQMHFGNYYGVWNFGVDKPKLQVGQFVIPFGTLAEYDTHPLILQTPYARTLGVRIDRGVAVQGSSGKTDWRLSLTSGDGRGRTNGSYAANLRLAHDFERGSDAYRVGLSLLHGRQMPVFHIDPMPLPMHMDSLAGRADKDRLALDLDWLHGIDNIRAELTLGRDDHDFVHGAWLSWSHPFSYATELTLQGDYWNATNGSVVGLGVGVHHKLDELNGFRVAYEPRWARPDDMPRDFGGLVTVQYYRRFSIGF